MNKLTFFIAFVVIVLGFSQAQTVLAVESVTLVSPNGGEIYKLGDTVEVKWNSSVALGSLSIDLDYYPLGNQSVSESKLMKLLTPMSLSGVTSFIIPTNYSPGKYTVTISGYAVDGGPIMVDASNSFFTITQSVPNSVHPEGTNILGSNGTVYRIMNSTRMPYTSASAFLSYKFNTWATLVTASSADMDLPLGSKFDGNHWYETYISPRPGSLINDKGTVYLITANAKRGFTSEKVFKDLGYSYNYVYPGDTSFLLTQQPIASSTEVHPQGTLINNNGTLYIMHIQGRIGVPSMAVLESWGYWANDAVKANSADISLNEVAVLTLRESTEFDLFFKYQ